MSDHKKEAMFAKLAQQHAKANLEDTAASAEPPTEQPPPSPALPEAVKARPSGGRKKAEPASGKRANSDYCQANAYIPKSVRKAVHKALLDMDGTDYSTLLTELLRKWLKSRGVAE